MLDMICPVNITSFQLSDLKKSPLSVRLLNALVNWRKFYAQEVTEGSERVLDETGRELSDWERFCSEEYETMMENEEEFDENFCVYLDDDEPHNATV
uniref:DNA helicase n=1 Tax=Angiostrongylus cantonensis TaxID=6313 RepID=A0A0K0D7S2_ANGCA